MSSSLEESSLNYIFDNITLYNYKMHRKTTLNLAEKPLIVISGANGSGKSQILEALILVLGYTPGRVALSKHNELIGSFDNFSSIHLSLRNPKIGERRFLTTSDPELTPFVEEDSFILTFEITESRSNRTIRGEDGKELSVTRKQVKRLMKNIGIYDDTILNFTEEGYLSSFSEGSPHKKLDTLLIATGLKDIYESYLESKKRVETKSREQSPLIFQLEKEKNQLERMKEDFELIQQKKDLIERFTEIQLELGWFDFKIANTHLIELRNNIARIEKTLTELKTKHQNLIEQIEELSETYQRLGDEKSSKLHSEEQLITQRNKFEGIVEEKERNIVKLENELEQLKQKKIKLEKILLDQDNEEITELQRNLEKKRNKIQQVNSIIESKEGQYKEKIIEKEKVEKILEERSKIYGSLDIYLKNRINDVLLFQNQIKQSNFSEEIIGPIFQVISIKTEYEQYKTAIKAALGYSLFDFVATTNQAYEESKRIYDQLSDHKHHLNLTVGRVLEIPGPRPQTYDLYLANKPEGIIDYIVNLLEGPFPVLNYLKKFKKVVLAEPYLSANMLTDFAKKHKISVLTSDNASFYLSREAFTRPPRSINLKLGIDIERYKSLSRVKDRLNRINETIGDLKKEKFEALQILSTLQTQKKELESKLRLFQSEDDLEMELVDLGNELDRLQATKNSEKKEVENIHEELDKKEKTINSLETEILELNTKLNNNRKTLANLKQQEEEIERDREKNLRLLNTLRMELSQQKETVESLKLKAEELGDKPKEIRDERESINSELHEIKGQLAQIEINPNLDRKTLSEQENRVEKLQRLIEEGKEHLDNLKSDLNKRLNHWVSGLKKIVDHLNGTLKHLLQQVFENISVKVSNYQDETDSKLVIEAMTKGDNRPYRQLSGGEKTLIAQAIILSLHLISYSPLHVIDEFTQKLDKKNRAHAFSMALTIHNLAKRNRQISPQFVLITPYIEDVDLTEAFTHKILIETKVLL